MKEKTKYQELMTQYKEEETRFEDQAKELKKLNDDLENYKNENQWMKDDEGGMKNKYEAEIDNNMNKINFHKHQMAATLKYLMMAQKELKEYILPYINGDFDESKLKLAEERKANISREKKNLEMELENLEKSNSGILEENKKRKGEIGRLEEKIEKEKKEQTKLRAQLSADNITPKDKSDYEKRLQESYKKVSDLYGERDSVKTIKTQETERIETIKQKIKSLDDEQKKVQSHITNENSKKDRMEKYKKIIDDVNHKKKYAEQNGIPVYELETTKKEPIVWDNLPKDLIDEAKERGIDEPYGDEYEMFLKEHGINIKPSAKAPSVSPTTPPVQTPPAQTPPPQTPPAQTPPAQTPPAQTPPVQTPPVQTPPAQTPPAQTPPVQTPPAQTPTAKSSVIKKITIDAESGMMYVEDGSNEIGVYYKKDIESAAVTKKIDLNKVINGILKKNGKKPATLTRKILKKVNPLIIKAISDYSANEEDLQNYIKALKENKKELLPFDYEIDLSDSTLSKKATRKLNKVALKEREILGKEKVKGAESFGERIKKFFGRNKKAIAQPKKPKELPSAKKFRDNSKLNKNPDDSKMEQEIADLDYEITNMFSDIEMQSDKEKSEKFKEIEAVLKGGPDAIGQKFRVNNPDVCLRAFKNNNKVMDYTRKFQAAYKKKIFEFEVNSKGKPVKLKLDNDGKHIIKDDMVKELSECKTAKDIAHNYFQEEALARAIFENPAVKKEREANERAK